MVWGLIDRFRRRGSSETDRPADGDPTERVGTEHPANDAGSGDGDAGSFGSDHDGTVWDLIPFWQYEGRHVESGGLARNEQERAIAEVQEEAAELAERERHRDP